MDGAQTLLSGFVIFLFWGFVCCCSSKRGLFWDMYVKKKYIKNTCAVLSLYLFKTALLAHHAFLAAGLMVVLCFVGAAHLFAVLLLGTCRQAVG